MDRFYKNVSSCATLLKNCDMPTIEKLRMERDFIEMKRILLRDEPCGGVRPSSHGEEIFEKLLHQTRTTCEGSFQMDHLPDLKNQVHSVLSALRNSEESCR